jgi:hypothetical protein
LALFAASLGELCGLRFRFGKSTPFTAKFAKEIRKGRKGTSGASIDPIELAKPAKFCKNNGLSQPA